MLYSVKKFLPASALIFIVTFLSYGNSFKNKFAYDDIPLIVENNYIRNWRSLPKLFSADMWSLAPSGSNPEKLIYYRPLSMASFIIDNKLWGLGPEGCHFTNTLFHSFNGILVFLIANALTGNIYAAAAAGLLFAVHPAQTESVTFISSRGEVLFLFFSLLSIITFIKGKTLYSTAAFCMALLSKETSLIIPVLLLLISYYFAREKLKIKYFIPFIAVAAAYLVLRSLFLPMTAQGSAVMNSINRFLFMMTMGAVIYMKILLFPVELSADYYIRYPVPLFEFKSVFSIAITFSALIAAYFTRKNIKAASFSALWFFAALIPASHLLYPMPYLIAERQLYLPSVGFCIFAGWAFFKASEKYKKLAVVFFTALLLFYSARTIYRNFDWGDELLLWGKVLKQFPDNPKAHMNIGIAYAGRGRFDKAIEHYKKAQAMNYYPEQVHISLAEVFRKSGRKDLALKEYIEAAKINPLAGRVHNDIGNIYMETGKTDNALKEYLFELSINPQESETYNNIGIVYAIKGDYKTAEKYFKIALHLDPLNQTAARNLYLLNQKNSSKRKIQ